MHRYYIQSLLLGHYQYIYTITVIFQNYPSSVLKAGSIYTHSYYIPYIDPAFRALLGKYWDIIVIVFQYPVLSQ